MKRLFVINLLLAIALILAACVPAATQGPAITQAAQQTQAPVKTTAPAATQARAAATAPAATLPPNLPKPGVAGHLVLATTTSTQDSGLLDYLLPMFEQVCSCKVDVIAVGTGQALQIGQNGDADVLLVHARAQEDAFMAAGHGVRREDVMYNDFIILGPASDPAGIKGTSDAVEAFKKIATTQSKFISRGDKSGTNTKELAIWKSAGITPSGDWYVAAGQGMGEVLTMSAELQAYTLSDRATYLTMKKQGVDLDILVEGGKDLLNPYGVIAVDPKKNASIQADLAQKFIDWIISVPVQEKIEQFGQADYGQILFHPSSKLWLEAHPVATATP